MQKKGRKLTLSKETLRTLTKQEMDGVQGGATRFCTGAPCSEPSLSCWDTCVSCGSAACTGNSCETC